MEGLVEDLRKEIEYLRKELEETKRTKEHYYFKYESEKALRKAVEINYENKENEYFIAISFIFLFTTLFSAWLLM